jgi:hypothetical protein
MLRTEVDEETIFFLLGFEGIKQSFVIIRNRDMFFAQRVMVDPIVEEKIREVRMAFEIDAEEFVNLPFIPARHCIDMGNRRRNGLTRVKLQCHLDPAQFFMCIKEIDEFEVFFVINAKEVNKIEASPVKELDNAQDVLFPGVYG